MEARLYKKEEGNVDYCYLCSFHCKIKEGKVGICGVRENKGGTLYTLVYDQVVARSLDPVEKKPLFHFQPGSTSYSIATVGCNFRCLHCQNYHISQMPKDEGTITGEEITPEEIVMAAEESGASSIAYTYTEPTIFFELAEDTGYIARERGISNIFVSNGYMTRECIDELDSFLDGINVDLKFFQNKVHIKECGGAKIEHVLDAIEYLHEKRIWMELTTLIIPTLNDSEEELRDIARWIYNLDKRIPWHISAFYPTYKQLSLPPTPLSIIDRAREIGLEEGLRYVYTGNVPGDPGESTYCYNCKTMLIERYGFVVQSNRITEGSRCPECGAEIDGVELGR